jgi:glycerol-3-phosphate dehydrogenase
MAGPTAVDIEDKEGNNTTSEQIADLLSRAKLSTPALPTRQIITSFAGLRAHLETDDFVIEEVKDAPGFIDVAGIESPGLSSAPAIGAYVAGLIDQIQPAEDNPDFNPKRKGIVCMQEASLEEKQKLIAENPAYANVICRCEMVTEGEILDAIHRPLGATTQDGVKRRTRAGMGRCQSGFCSPKTVEILARELGKDMAEITKNGGKSAFLTGYNKEDL